MRTLFAVLVAILFAPVLCYSQLWEASPAPGEIVKDRQDNQSSATLRGESIWSETFENGISAEWGNIEENGIAYWEYRGPETNPDIYIGSRGSCIPEGQSGSDPIESDTWADGFVIFDSNYWDDNIGPCIEGFGTGPSPGPHDASLITPSIDFTDYDEVFLSFHHFYKEWTNNSVADIQYRINEGPWINLYTVEVESGNSTTADDRIAINISDQAGGEGNFQIRFHFEGTYYYWMLDDINFFVPDNNNVLIYEAGFDDFDIYDGNNVSGFDGLEYTMYPDEMPPTLNFEARLENAGSETQTDVTLHVEVVNVNTEEVLYAESSTSTNLVSQQISIFTTPSFTMPGVQGEYEIRYTASQNEEDEVPEDNLYTFAFNINDVTFAKDHRSTTGIYLPPAMMAETHYEIGNMFVIGEDDMAIHSVSVGCGVGSTNGTPVYGAIYKFNLNAFTETELIAQTPTQNLYWEAQNDFGDNKTMVIPFTDPVVLDKDSAYLVVAGVESGPQDLVFAMSGNAEPLSSWVRFFPTTWYYMQQNPMVRMNFGEVVGIDEFSVNDAEVYTAYPNPAADNTNLRFELNKAIACRIEVFDPTGRKVKDIQLGTLGKGLQTIQIPTNDLSAGMYTLSLLTGKARHSQQLIITK